jgi:GntR family transcriptional regulator/MocR family aminotransferase
MSLERRKKLLALAEKFNFKIIENDDDYFFNDQKIPHLPIASAKNAQQVIYIGSLDKSFSNNLSTGYIVADANLIQRFASKHALISQHSTDISEIALAQLLSSGQIKKHINRNKKVYAARKKHLMHLIKKELGGFATANHPSYGLSCWLTLNTGIDLKILKADLIELKISITTGEGYTSTPNKQKGLILGFGNLNEAEATEGVLRIKHAMLKQTLSS